MSRTLLANGLLLDPERPDPTHGKLLLEEGRIAARLEPDAAEPRDVERIDLGGLRLAPGLIDLHLHGASAFASLPRIDAMLRHDAGELLRHGVSAFLPTTFTAPETELCERVAQTSRAMAAIDANADGRGGAGQAPRELAVPLGLHLEGPWISLDALGAQPGEGARPFRAGDLERLDEAAQGRIAMLTLAPEVRGAAELLRESEAIGALPALGHTRASSDATRAAVDRGARHVTHQFNAKGPLHQRAPGILGVALSDDALSCDIICDGVHVAPEAIRIATRAKAGRLLLISDRLDPLTPAHEATDPGGPGLEGVRDAGDAWRLADGTLAGSRIHLDEAIRRIVATGAMTQLEAVSAASWRPARALGIEAERGSLRVGARADFAIFDAEGRVRETWVAGRRVRVDGAIPNESIRADDARSAGRGAP